MKRLAGALSTALLLLAMFPGQVAATAVGTLDQSDETVAEDYNLSVCHPTVQSVGQTITAGRTGRLTHVELNLRRADTVTVSLLATSGGLPTGSALATTSQAINSPDAWTWVDFTFASPVLVSNGIVYAIVASGTHLNTGSSLCVPWRYGLGYVSGSSVYNIGSGWVADPGDLAFRTYVKDLVTLSWDRGQVVAGATATVVLTETFDFPPVNPALQPNVLSRFLVQTILPTWFTPTGVACSSQVAGADCIVANLALAGSMPVSPDGSPITLTITGTASPPGSAVAGTATAEAAACTPVSNVVPALEIVATCVRGSANIAVVGAVTPPPGTTATTSSSGTGASLWFLPGLVLAMIGTGLLLVRRERIDR